MGRIKELQDKKAKDGLTEAELKELNELLMEAKEAEADDAEEESSDESVDAEVEELADKLVGVVEQKTQAYEKDIADIKRLLEKDSKEVEVVSQAKFIVNPKDGSKKSIDEMAENKVVIDSRKNKGKKSTMVSEKTWEFVKALHLGQKEKLQLLTEGTGAQGGFLVPDEFANMIVEDRRDATVMRSIADVLTTSSDTFHIPNLDTRPKANWRGETAAKSTSTVTFGETVLTPYSLAVIVGMSNELEADASLGVGASIVNYVAEKMATSLSEAEDRAFFIGSGTGQPTGMSTYTLGTIASGLTDSNRADTIKQTYTRLGQQYRNSSVWVANASTWEQIRTLKDSNNNYLMRSLDVAPSETLMGRPIKEQNDIADGTLYFGDFSYYKIVDREGVRVDISREATVASTSAFEQNLTYVRVEQRTDGELVNVGGIRSATNMS